MTLFTLIIRRITLGLSIKDLYSNTQFVFILINMDLLYYISTIIGRNSVAFLTFIERSLTETSNGLTVLRTSSSSCWHQQVMEPCLLRMDTSYSTYNRPISVTVNMIPLQCINGTYHRACGGTFILSDKLQGETSMVLCKSLQVVIKFSHIRCLHMYTYVLFYFDRYC